ncbi:TlpA family protein disulfide reductase [Ramlibacter tataouinensis]|uniref:TlpA family protein disulfide reductase n=1 Tax=Ramlibacter tataouinensis TaxID=94132 RepID=UPI0009EE3690|nr:TlpA disulfide reductase family protein [Ramlibacter tataouinensis]
MAAFDLQLETASSRRCWLIAAALLPLAPAALAESGSQRRPWPRSRPTPAVELRFANGDSWTPASSVGSPVLLNFWASWCEPCRAEMPSLQALARHRQANGLRVLAINYKESEAAVRRFTGSTGLDLPVLFDPEGAAAKAFGVRIFPSTVAIDRSGRVRFVVTGEFDWNSPLAGRWVSELL